MRARVKKVINLVSPNMSRSIRNYRASKILSSPPQTSPDGIKFWGMQNYASYEPAVLGVLEKLMSQSDVFVNVGANHAIYCVKLSKYASKVYAFEALSQNLEFIYKNVIANNLSDKITVFPVAVGSSESLVTFYGATSGGSLLKGWNQQIDSGVTVPMFSLDFILSSKNCGRKPLFLIDVEGAEFEVIKGARNIVNNIPDARFCVEIPCREFMPNEEFNPNFVDIFKYFDELGFKYYEISNDGSLSGLDMSEIERFAAKPRFEGVMAVFSRTALEF